MLRRFLTLAFQLHAANPRLARPVPLFPFLFSIFCLFCAPTAHAQAEIELRAKARLFADAPLGITALKSSRSFGMGDSHHYYLLAARGATVLVYDAAGARVGCLPEGCAGHPVPGASAELNAQVPSQPAGEPKKASSVQPQASSMQYGADLDVACWQVTSQPGGAPSCFVYVADRAANAIKVFAVGQASRPVSPAAPATPAPKIVTSTAVGQASTPVLVRTITVLAPTSVAALAEEEVAVATMRAPRLVTVFDRNGKVAREFGEPTEVAQTSDLNRFLNVGRLASDPASHLYYSYSYLPEPTVKKFDRFGYATLEIELTSLDFAPASQAARREISRADRPGARTADVRLVVSAIGVDPETQEIWMGIGGLLVHFSADGARRGTYRIFTAEGARLEAAAILVEPSRLLVASETLGIFEFLHPERSRGARPVKMR